MTEKSQVAMIWWAMAFGTIFGIGFYLTGFLPPPSPSLGAAEVAELYVTNNLKMRIGVVLCICSGAFMLPWTVVVAVQMARLEEDVPVWAILQGLAGALGTIIFMLPAMFWGVAAFSAERAADITLLMHENAFLNLVTPVTWFAFQTIPIGVVALTQKSVEHSAFPRWVGYLSIWTALLAEAGVLALIFKTGPFAWDGILAFWVPLIIFGIWITAINVSMLKALKDQAAARTVST